MSHFSMCINGEWRDSRAGERIAVRNPATEEVFATAAQADTRDVEEAIGGAAAAFAPWAALSPKQRGNYLRRASQLVTERCNEIAALMTQELGKPLAEARGEVRKGAEILSYYAEEGERLYGRIVANAEADMESHVMYQPLGPVAAISPWNYPVELLAWKVGAALASGCTVVAKPPTLTPLSPLQFVRCITDAGVPPGAISVCPGPGKTVGLSLTKSPLVRKVAFTGSTETGREVLAQCTSSFKKVSLELGGHCPLIIDARCNLNEAVSGAVRRSFRNMGQICIAINRIYVQSDIYDPFMKAFVEQTSKLVIGNGLTDNPCDLGPMASADGVEKVKRHIDDALSKGAHLARGGKRPAGFGKGFFFEPTILTDVNHSMIIMREETFGPAVGVMPFGALDEAIELANDTPYGLACYAYTDSLDNADRLARELNAGNVAINNADAGVINAPYGGWNESGLGFEHGPEGIREYVRAKHIRLRYLHRRGSRDWRDVPV